MINLFFKKIVFLDNEITKDYKAVFANYHKIEFLKKLFIMFCNNDLMLYNFGAKKFKGV